MASTRGFLFGVIAVLGLAAPPAVSGAKIMIAMPNFINSVSQHIIFSSMTEPLVERGHEVILLAPQHKVTKGLTDEAITGEIFFKTTRTKEEMVEIAGSLQTIAVGMSTASFREIIAQVRETFPLFAEGCFHLFKDAETLERLKREQFDLMITIPMTGCDAILAEYLRVPFVAMTPLRRAPFFNEDMMGIPAPSSYVPFSALTTFTDQMTFFQRVANLVIRNFGDPLMKNLMRGDIARIQKEHNIRPDLSVDDLLGKAQLWLTQGHWAFEYAQPISPNYLQIGGITCKKPKPLPKEINDFVEGSGEHGIVVFTLGSIVSSLMNEEINDKFAKVFSELPQRVLWRLKGYRPRNLGNNTLISDWLPQADLLGHPKTKLMIYHGGANGVNEIVAQGVPALIMPLAGDQMGNAVRLESKGMGRVYDKNTFTEESFREAVTEMLRNPKYMVNAKKASAIMNDEVVPVREQLVHKIEHILKFGGDHLRIRALELNFIQRESLDVLAFLLAVFLAFVFTIRWLVCKCCCGKRGSAGKSKSD